MLLALGGVAVARALVAAVVRWAPVLVFMQSSGRVTDLALDFDAYSWGGGLLAKPRHEQRWWMAPPSPPKVRGRCRAKACGLTSARHT